MPYSQAEQKSAECGLLGLFDAVQQVAHRFFSHALKLNQGIKFEAKQVCGGFYPFLVNQYFNQFATQALNVDGTSMRKMNNRLRKLGFAHQAACTPESSFALFFLNQ